LTKAQAWDGLLSEINRQIEGRNLMVKSGSHVDGSKKHRDALKTRGIKNGIQDKAVKNKPLSPRQLARNKAISKVRFVVERTFGGQQRWFGGKVLRYQGLAKAHAWHILLVVA
jgi:IS5 family transposase